MKKLLLLLLSVSFLFVSMPASADSPIRVKVNGALQSYDQPPEMINGSVLVPLRGIFESLGASLSVTGKNIKAVHKDTVVHLTIGSAAATINGAGVKLAQKAVVMNGRTLVPIRFVSEALGAEVKWSSADRMVFVSRRGAAPATPEPAPPAAVPIEDMSKIDPLNEKLYKGQALVTLSYDDGYRNWYNNALPLHSKYNFPGTFNIIGNKIYSGEEGFMNSSHVWVSHDLGIEIASHTQTHPFLTTQTESEIREEFKTSKFILEDLVGEVSTIAIPYSAYNDDIREIALDYFDGVRVFSRETNTENNYDPHWLKSFAVVNTTEFSTIQGWIDRAIEEKSWVIIMLHGITEERLGEYETTPQILGQVMQYINDQGKDKIMPVSTRDGVELMNKELK
ncbi:stalk domain-containing protein [Paenibacillus sp. JSM ZJ436]|uniref:stalk domain-containing protein n=1 Tax=Paenibacillus sp. JSM ZJ436 TaxID=3376190 RepID=UPI003788EDB6